MSTDATGAIGPVSVRYAAQIRELLYAQAVQRMVADQQAARAQSEADRTARIEAVAKTRESEPLDVKVQPTDNPTPVKQPDPATDKPATAGQLVDIQA